LRIHCELVGKMKGSAE